MQVGAVNLKGTRAHQTRKQLGCCSGHGGGQNGAARSTSQLRPRRRNAYSRTEEINPTRSTFSGIFVDAKRLTSPVRQLPDIETVSVTLVGRNRSTLTAICLTGIN
jgi:hypothetical protein